MSDQPERETKHPVWVQDIGKAAQYLTTLTLQSSAEAALLTAGNQLVASAGQFGRGEIDELARIVVANWNSEHSQSAQVRFIRMGNGQDYLLYSTLVGGFMVLSLVFVAETPLRNIRQQARQLIDGLLTGGANIPGGEAPPTSPVNPARAEDTRWFEPLQPPTDLPPQARLPETEPQAEDTAPPEWQHQASNPPPAELIDLTGLHNSQQIPGLEGVYRTPHALYKLTYTFLWLPKLPNSALQGDIVTQLQRWVRDLCLAYDWRLEQLEIQDEFLQVIVACSPADSPEKVVKTLMDATSERIMNEFPRIAERHPNRQFWAPGYFVVTPGRRLRPDEVSRYIDYQRREQGLR